jgi:hypothetical protein
MLPFLSSGRYPLRDLHFMLAHLCNGLVNISKTDALFAFWTAETVFDAIFVSGFPLEIPYPKTGFRDRIR